MEKQFPSSGSPKARPSGPGYLLEIFLLRVTEFFRKQNPIHQVAQYMTQGDMGFLNSCRCVRFHGKHKIGACCDLAAATGQSDGEHPDIFCRLYGFDNIFRTPAGTDSHGNIIFSSQSRNLFGEDFVKVIIIPDAGDDGGVGGERQRRKGRPFNLKPVNEFGGNMLGIRGTPAVSENQDFVTGDDARCEDVRPSFNEIDVVFYKSVFDVDAVLKYVENNLFHGLTAPVF